MSVLKALLSRPALAALAIGIATVVAATLAVTNLTVEGDVARAMKGVSDAFLAHEELEERFDAPSKDEIFLVQADDFGDPETFAALEDLVLGFQLTDGVKAVVSVFNLPDPDRKSRSYLSRSDIAVLSPTDRLDGLLKASPLAPFLLSQDRNAALLTVIPDLSVPADLRLANLQQEITAASPALAIHPVGLAALHREISDALVSDQIFITPLAVIFCIFIAMTLFRSWRAAVLCSIPSLVGLGWTIGAMAILGLPFNPFMAIVPTLILVLGVADSVHVFYSVVNHANESDIKVAITRGLRETMPAVILAALTTALAFSCLLFVGSPTLNNVAIIGPIAMALTTLSVFITLPPAILLIYKDKQLTQARPFGFRFLTGIAVGLLNRSRSVALTAIIALAVLVGVQTQTVIGYRPMDHIPQTGGFQATLAELNAVLPGSDISYVILKSAENEKGISEDDLKMLERAGNTLFGIGAGLAPTLTDREGESANLNRFESKDGRAFALPLIGQLNRSSADILISTQQAYDNLENAGIHDAKIAGYSLMASVELPIIVHQLRIAFYVAVALVTVLAAWLLRSVRVAVLSLVPNLIPILVVEAWLVAMDHLLTMISAIAFTIAFGIAVDDSIHLMNRIRLARKPDAAIDRNAIEVALRATTAPILTTSFVLIAGMLVTAFSLLPSVSIFGQLTAAAIALAVVADLFLFPSLLCWGAVGVRTR